MGNIHVNEIMYSIQIISMAKSANMKMTKIAKILNRLMAEKKIRVAELARQVNLPQPTIHRIATGACEHPHLSSLKPIANFFSVSVDQLKGHELIPWLDRASRIPFLTWEQVLSWSSNKNELHPEELIFTDANVGKNGFALKINDAAMDPVFPKNTLLITDPDKLPKDRSYVIAKLANVNIPIFRQLLIDVEDRYLKALSPDFEKYRMTRLNDGDKILSVVVQAKRDYED
jgi:transcriptional regulator with XRE-family HTH domain